MAIFEITEGAPGQGKSLYTAKTARKLLERNRKWESKGNPRRILRSNLKFSEQFEQEFSGYIEYWSDASELVKFRDCDIIWDEIATELDSRNWANLSVEMKRFLSQYRKRGIDIYANTQDFSMIDQRARLMVTHVRRLTKICGSRDLSTTKPNPKHIWGVILVREVSNFKATEVDKKKFEIFPSFFFIEKGLVSIYDTRQDIALGKPAPLRHEVRRCSHHRDEGGDGSCDFCKVFHV